jgi:hypothetical protein
MTTAEVEIALRQAIVDGELHAEQVSVRTLRQERDEDLGEKFHRVYAYCDGRTYAIDCSLQLFERAASMDQFVAVITDDLNRISTGG